MHTHSAQHNSLPADWHPVAVPQFLLTGTAAVGRVRAGAGALSGRRESGASKGPDPLVQLETRGPVFKPGTFVTVQKWGSGASHSAFHKLRCKLQLPFEWRGRQAAAASAMMPIMIMMPLSHCPGRLDAKHRRHGAIDQRRSVNVLVPEVDTTHSDRVAVHCPLSPTQQPAHWHCDWSAVSAGLACTTATGSLRFKLQCPNCIGPGFNLT